MPNTVRVSASVLLFVQTCPVESCGILFGIPDDVDTALRKNGRTFYCPNGHHLSFTPGKSDADKLRDERARSTHLEDQLFAAMRDAERTRGELIKARVRFAAGMCPAGCRRTFDNVRRHIGTEHPDYSVDDVAKSPEVKCSCGRSFGTVHGLHIHQSRSRTSGWWKPSTSAYSAHLTKA